MSPGMFPGLSAKRTVRFRASSICRLPLAGRCFAPPYPAARDNPGNGGKGKVWIEWHNAGVLSICAANRNQRIQPPLKGLPRAVHAAQRHSREGYRRGHACMNPGRFLAAYFRGTPPHEYETAGDCILGNPRSFRKCGSRAVTALVGCGAKPHCSPCDLKGSNIHACLLGFACDKQDDRPRLKTEASVFPLLLKSQEKRFFATKNNMITVRCYVLYIAGGKKARYNLAEVGKV